MVGVQCGQEWLRWERQLSLDSKPERWRWGYSVGWGGKGSCLWTRSLRGGGGGRSG